MTRIRFVQDLTMNACVIDIYSLASTNSQPLFPAVVEDDGGLRNCVSIGTESVVYETLPEEIKYLLSYIE